MGIAATLGLRATLALVSGDLAGLGRDGSRSARMFRELGDPWGELQTVSPLAALAEIKGAYEEAERRQHEGLVMARELGLQAEVSARLSGLGRLALLARDFDRARDLHEQARRIAAEQGYKYGEIHSGMGLALGARRSGDLDAAEAHLLHLRDGYADVSSQAGDHLLLAELGFVAELRGDAHAAEAHHLAGLVIARTLANPGPWLSPWKAWPARPPSRPTPPPPPSGHPPGRGSGSPPTSRSPAASRRTHRRRPHHDGDPSHAGPGRFQ